MGKVRKLNVQECGFSRISFLLEEIHRVHTGI